MLRRNIWNVPLALFSEASFVDGRPSVLRSWYRFKQCTMSSENMLSHTVSILVRHVHGGHTAPFTTGIKHCTHHKQDLEILKPIAGLPDNLIGNGQLVSFDV